MFAGGIEDRLRAREQLRQQGYRSRYPLNSSGHVENVKDYSHSCHHIAELKEKQRWGPRSSPAPVFSRGFTEIWSQKAPVR